MKKVILSVALLLIVSVSYAGEKPWYERFAAWFECTWLGSEMIKANCIKTNYMAKDLIGRKYWDCKCRVYHGSKDGIIR